MVSVALDVCDVSAIVAYIEVWELAVRDGDTQAVSARLDDCHCPVVSQGLLITLFEMVLEVHPVAAHKGYLSEQVESLDGKPAKHGNPNQVDHNQQGRDADKGAVESLVSEVGHPLIEAVGSTDGDSIGKDTERDKANLQQTQNACNRNKRCALDELHFGTFLQSAFAKVE